MLVVVLALALPLVSALAGMISRPVLSLAETASHISAEGDYSARAVKVGEDELGQLVDRFNEMLEQIEFRDRAVHAAQDRLEERIDERTATLRRREWWLATILRSMGDGVVATDADGRVTFVNEAAEELTGRRREHALGKPLLEVLRLEQEVSLDTESGRRGTLTGIATLVDATGVEHPVEYSTATIPDAPEGEEGTVVVVRDVSVRREAEQATTLQRLQALVENLPAGVVHLAPDNTILLANPPAVEYLLLLADAAVGAELRHLADRSIANLLEHSVGGQRQIIASSGPHRRSFELTANAIAHDGVQLGHTLVLREMTEELDNRRRMEQQERLAAVGQLAAGIAHDFNNMLQAITGYAELIRIQHQLPDEVLRRINDIASQGRRGARLIRQILDFSRKSITERQPIDLAPFLAEVVKMLRHAIPENISIVNELASDQCQVLADPTQIQQLVTNLAVNARDAMPSGGELTIRLAFERLEPADIGHMPHMQPGNWVVLSVSDTGVGIQKEAQERMFEPFFTTKRTGEGTGLGLSQVYGIVKQQEGFIDFASVEGTGTTFYVYLPPISGSAEPTTPSGEFPTLTAGLGKRILVVEDEPMVLSMTREILEAFGFEVLTAVNGRKALELLNSGVDGIDAVVSDMVMPEMGGLELWRQLRETRPGLRMVLMSGYPLGETVQDQARSPGLRWISKPYTATQLGRVVMEVLRD